MPAEPVKPQAKKASDSEYELDDVITSQNLKSLHGDNQPPMPEAPLQKAPSVHSAPPEESGHEGEHDHSVKDIPSLMKELDTTSQGLSTQEAEVRKAKYGPNSLPEEKKSSIKLFLSFMWNPLAWAMEVAALISIIQLDYADFALIIFLLLLNSSIAFYEEHNSANAIAALKAQLAPSCKCRRDRELKKLNSDELVPGDVIFLRLGDVVPADCYVIDGEGLKIDQSSLTGESLPVSKGVGKEVYSGSVVKQGEANALVTATGVNSFFGKTAAFIASTENSGHFQSVLRSIGGFCLSLIACFVILELVIEFVVFKRPCHSIINCYAVENILVLIVGGIPIAMPTVLSITMAIGASQLAKKKAIVSRLTAVEELAAMDVLCSDKTGTLTKNHLTVADPITYDGLSGSKLMFQAALASKPETEDAIDIAMVESLTEEKRAKLQQYRVLFFHPFDPIGKMTWAKVQSPEGQIFHCAKGAPQVILRDAINREEIAEKVKNDINDLAKRGYRSLGVGVSTEEGKDWLMTGIIPMFDPPRDDTAATIEKIRSLGVSVKMITGDQLAIAQETARLLGLGSDMYAATDLLETAEQEGVSVSQLILEADGFAQVFPENKYQIVENLQQNKHVVGMTGDGVNDAPALKKADIGIAVHGATDAARSASDIVLMSPGLSVIADAIIGSRKIFQRMKNYATYSIMAVVRIVFTFGLLTVIFNWLFPTIAVVILAILNDGCMLTISKDRVKPNQEPDSWNLKEIFGVATGLGMWLTASTIVLWVLCVYTSFFQLMGLHTLSMSELRGLIYLQVSITNLSAIFVTRSHGFSLKERPGNWVIFAFIFAQVVASFLGAYGLGGYPWNGATDFEGAGWGYVIVAWIWSAIWYFGLDPIKFRLRKMIRKARAAIKKRRNRHQVEVQVQP